MVNIIFMVDEIFAREAKMVWKNDKGNLEIFKEKKSNTAV